MQFCSTRQFISCSQTLVALQPPAAVLPADAAQPLTSTFTKVMAPAAASTWLPSLEEQDRLNNRAPAARPGTPTHCTFNHHIQPRRANSVSSGHRCSRLTWEERCSRCLWCSGTVSQLPAGGGGVMEPINRRTEHERSRLLYIRPVLAEAAEYRSSSILCGDLEIWNVQAVFFPMICLNYFLWVCIMAI